MHILVRELLLSTLEEKITEFVCLYQIFIQRGKMPLTIFYKKIFINNYFISNVRSCE